MNNSKKKTNASENSSNENLSIATPFPLSNAINLPSLDISQFISSPSFEAILESKALKELQESLNAPAVNVSKLLSLELNKTNKLVSEIINQSICINSELLKPILEVTPIFDFSKYFSEFMNSTATLGSVNHNLEKAIVKSLEVTRKDFLENISLFSQSVDWYGAIKLDTDNFNSSRVQRDDVIEIMIGNSTHEQEIISLKSVAIPEKARKILFLFKECSKASNLKNNEMFSKTNKVLEAFYSLPFLIVTNQDELGILVDHLYSLLYENAGKDNLRYIEPIGPLRKDEIEIIFVIKTLRNKWLRHDSEHGQSKDIRKSNNSLKSSLGYLNFNYLPVVKEDYEILQISIYDEVINFLTDLLQKINKFELGL